MTTGPAGRTVTRAIGSSAMGGTVAAASRTARPPAEKKKGKAKGKEEERASLGDETAFRNPFADDCQPHPAEDGARRGALLHRRGLVADRRLPLQRDRPRRRPVQLHQRRVGVPAVHQVKKLPRPRRRDVQARLDVLQAAALRDLGTASSSSCSATPTNGGEADGRSWRGFPRGGVHLHRRLAHVPRRSPAPDRTSPTSRGTTSSTSRPTRAWPSRRCGSPSSASRIPS